MTVPKRFFVLEPLLFLVCLSLFSSFPIQTQYIHYAVSRQYDPNGTLGTANKSLGYCDATKNQTKASLIMENKIQVRNHKLDTSF